MNNFAFDILARRTVDGVSRRASLATLSGAALAVAARPDVSEAKKKKGKSCGKKQKQKCNGVESQCVATGAALCQGDPDCLAAINLCCQECFADEFLNCLIAQQL